MKGTTANLSRKQELAIIALLTENSVTEAAKKVGVGETTLFRWLQIPAFQERYREARRQAFGQAIAMLQQSASKAVQTLVDIMTNTAAPASARVSAAKTMLETGARAIEIEDLAARVESLERELLEDGGRKRGVR